ncbi:MAG: PAS domain-containing protein [Patescibacteria group bacterium]|nr:PAS domain-containing protein [Patescibacteria group bacterium]
MAKTNISKKPVKDEAKILQADLDELEWYIDDFSTFLPLAVCTLNPLGIIVNVNKAFEVLTGYSVLDIVREPLSVVFLEKEAVGKMEEKAKQKGISKTELTAISKNGRKIVTTVSIAARKDKKGVFIGYFVAMTDITELKNLQMNLEGQVARKTKELQEKLADLEKFAKLVVGRELKMIELKNKIKEMEKADKI